ncbi:MAG: sugar phosphate isomerase/epimerase family protein [Limisphaerales bacterium]
MSQHIPSLNRREFLARTALGVGSLALAGCASSNMKAQKKIPVGLQLYSLRNECKADFPGTIAAVGKMGYAGVEFAGYWNYSASDIRKMLDDAGLVACGTHTSYESLLPDKLNETIEFNRTLGNKFLIVPYMTGKTRAEWLARAERLNAVAEALKPLGMLTGYHAHSHDFHPVEGEPAWDIFFRNTRPDVVMQLDTSNCLAGGADPVEVLRRYPGRGLSIHLKANGGGPEAVIGEDKVNWAGVFELCETISGTQWYVVEHESSRQPMVAVQRSLDALRAMGKA